MSLDRLFIQNTTFNKSIADVHTIQAESIGVYNKPGHMSSCLLWMIGNATLLTTEEGRLMNTSTGERTRTGLVYRTNLSLVSSVALI